MKKRWEIQKYTAWTNDYNNIDIRGFAYEHGDWEVTDVFDDEESALEALFSDGNPVSVTFEEAVGEYLVSSYAVQWVTYDDHGNYVDEGELIY